MAFVTYIDSAGLGALIEVYNRIQRSGGALRFANLQPRTATAL
jgi:anti-anti-sigma factor